MQYVCRDQEPSPQREFSQCYEKELTSLPVAKGAVICLVMSGSDMIVHLLSVDSSPVCIPLWHQGPPSSLADEHFV